MIEMKTDMKMRRVGRRFMTREQSSGGGYINGLITGVLVGAAAVFLTATKRGRILSKKMRQQSGKTLRELEKAVTEIEAKEFSEGESDGEKRLNYIEQLQEKGREVAQQFFKRNGRSLG